MPLPANVKAFLEDEVKQGSDAWHSLRVGVLTGSRCSPVMVDETKKKSEGRANLLVELAVERVTGKPAKSQSFSSDAMEQGLEREPDAIKRFESETFNFVKRVGFVYWVGKFVGCSPDGVLGDFDELVSIKCRELKAHYAFIRRIKSVADNAPASAWITSIPSDARRQMAHELWITGATKHHYVSFNPFFDRPLQYGHKELTRADLDVDAYGRAADAFLSEVDVEVRAMKQLAEGSGSAWAAAAQEVTQL